MCIVFLRSDPECAKSDYKLIIAANRDMYYTRPSKPAGFLQGNGSILCGLDMQKGVEGGTWLGVTKQGKFGFLTNYLTSQHMRSAVPRGRIVRNYLTSTSSADEYTQKRLVNQSCSPFNFIGGQFVDEGRKINIHYYSKKDETSPCDLGKGDYVISGSDIDVQWKKAKHGSEKFEKIVECNCNALDPSEFSESLIHNLLCDETKLYPDYKIAEQSKTKFSKQELESICSVMVTGLKQFGTRAQTVVLVDKNNHLFFTERSLVGSFQNKWVTKKYDFYLQLKN